MSAVPAGAAAPVARLPAEWERHEATWMACTAAKASPMKPVTRDVASRFRRR